jgi:hypothetical protein
MSYYRITLTWINEDSTSLKLFAQDRGDAVHKFTKTKFYREFCLNKRYTIDKVETV